MCVDKAHRLRWSSLLSSPALSPRPFGLTETTRLLDGPSHMPRNPPNPPPGERNSPSPRRCSPVKGDIVSGSGIRWRLLRTGRCGSPRRWLLCAASCVVDTAAVTPAPSWGQNSQNATKHQQLVINSLKRDFGVSTGVRSVRPQIFKSTTERINILKGCSPPISPNVDLVLQLLSRVEEEAAVQSQAANSSITFTYCNSTPLQVCHCY